MSKEKVRPEAMSIALLKEIQEGMLSMRNELEAMRKAQSNNTLHLKYEVDLSVAHTNEEIADFTEMGVEINAIIIMPVPSAVTFKLGGLEDEDIDLELKETFDLSGHSITRILATNEVGTGTVKIHVFGR